MFSDDKKKKKERNNKMKLRQLRIKKVLKKGEKILNEKYNKEEKI